MREDGKITRTVYTGNGVKSIELIDPPVKGKDRKVEPKDDDLETEKPIED